MIELLLQAERALSVGLLDRAETLYRQVANADPRNSIAVVGLARVTLDRGDDVGALALARRALEIDPENDAAIRLAARLEEVLDYRRDSAAVELGLEEPTPEEEATEPTAEPEATSEAEMGASAEPETVSEPAAAIAPEPGQWAEPAPESEPDVAAEPAPGVAPQPEPDPGPEPEPTPEPGQAPPILPAPRSAAAPSGTPVPPPPPRRRSLLDRLFRRR